MNTTKFPLLLFAVILLTAFLMVVIPGCNDSPSGTGILAVSLTDAPSCGYDAVNITVNKIRIHQSRNAPENAAGWEEILLEPPRKINLLGLTNGALEELGQIPLAAGHYTQLRLVLEENSGTVPANSVIPSGLSHEVALDTPSGMQSGLKLINEFDVSAGERVDLLLDFNACKSVVTRGNGSYGLKPVLRVLPITLSGIGGFVDPVDNVTVSAQRSGSVVRATVVDPLSGEFFISHLEPGSYDVVVTADHHATVVVAGVPIASTTSTAMISSETLPLSLPTATTHTISGTITLNPVSITEVAEASAQQIFPLGPTVTVKEHTVDLLSHAYTLTLPSTAPWLGLYGSGTLPIALTEQTSLAGVYNIIAAAPGYQSQSITKNIATADATQDFVLVP